MTITSQKSSLLSFIGEHHFRVSYGILILWTRNSILPSKYVTARYGSERGLYKVTDMVPGLGVGSPGHVVPANQRHGEVNREDGDYAASVRLQEATIGCHSA